MPDYETGEQPCKQFEPAEESAFIRIQPHVCPECDGLRAFCDNCCKDHHDGGWTDCWASTRESDVIEPLPEISAGGEVENSAEN